MKKRIQANLRGIEEPGNEIKPPTPDLLSNLDESTSNHKASSQGLTFKLPPPPAKTIQALENLGFSTPPLPPPPSCSSYNNNNPMQQNRLYSPLDTRPSSCQSNTYDAAIDEQLSNLCSGLNLKTDPNNNNLSKLYSFNNVSLGFYLFIIFSFNYIIFVFICLCLFLYFFSTTIHQNHLHQVQLLLFRLLLNQ